MLPFVRTPGVFCGFSRRYSKTVGLPPPFDPPVQKIQTTSVELENFGFQVAQEPGAVVVNGRRYPFPYPGIYKEYNYLKVLDKWRKEGKLDKHDRPLFYKMRGTERILAKQFWFQRDPTLPVWKLGKYDDYINGFMFFGMVCSFSVSMVCLYLLVVPPDENIFDYKNWDRWRKEAHH